MKQIEADKLFEDIKREQKNVMKNILNHSKMALDNEKFELFKKLVFNSFGTSGLESSTKNLIQKYVEIGD